MIASDDRRLVTVVLTVSDLDAATRLYRDAFGLDLQVDDHRGSDPFTTGRHAAATWDDGAFVHVALYERRPGRQVTTGAQVAFRVADVDVAFAQAVRAGARPIHGPIDQPWGRSTRFADLDGNVVELTQHG